MATVARPARFRLCLITDRKLAISGDLLATCEDVLAAVADRPGSIAIQLREKDLDGRALYDLAIRMRALCTRHGAPLIVNDRIDVAMAAGADGVHLPSASFTPAEARRLVGESKLVGISTHSAEEAACAASDGADFAVYGPVFTPLSKPAGYGPARGAEGLGAACRAAAAMPVYALGGITAARAGRLAGTGLAGAGVIGAVIGADHPGAAARAILDALERAAGASA